LILRSKRLSCCAKEGIASKVRPRTKRVVIANRFIKIPFIYVRGGAPLGIYGVGDSGVVFSGYAKEGGGLVAG
jgi:hypothetical protein